MNISARLFLIPSRPHNLERFPLFLVNIDRNLVKYIAKGNRGCSSVHQSAGYYPQNVVNWMMNVSNVINRRSFKIPEIVIWHRLV